MTAAYAASDALPVLVLGANGKTGRRVARRLRDLGLAAPGAVEATGSFAEVAAVSRDERIAEGSIGHA